MFHTPSGRYTFCVVSLITVSDVSVTQYVVQECVVLSPVLSVMRRVAYHATHYSVLCAQAVFLPPPNLVYSL